VTSISRLMLSPETLQAHRARWFVYAGGWGTPTEKIPHTATMRGTWAGYDVACSCGWESHTGGATRTSVEDDLFMHRLEAQAAAGDEGGAEPGGQPMIAGEGSIPSVATEPSEGGE
jgi:hypothetical protein